MVVKVNLQRRIVRDSKEMASLGLTMQLKILQASCLFSVFHFSCFSFCFNIFFQVLHNIGCKYLLTIGERIGSLQKSFFLKFPQYLTRFVYSSMVHKGGKRTYETVRFSAKSNIMLPGWDDHTGCRNMS